VLAACTQSGGDAIQHHSLCLPPVQTGRVQKNLAISTLDGVVTRVPFRGSRHATLAGIFPSS
jgi:hypothetical protein